MIQKLETGYLQFLRVVFLVAASIAIVVAIFCGVTYALRHDAEPESVQDEVRVSLANYTAPISSTNNPDQGPTLSESEAKDTLLEKFAANLASLGKKTDPDFSINRDAVIDVYNNFKQNPELGTSFIQQLNGVLEAALSKPDVVARMRSDFTAELARIMKFTEREYKMQAEKIQAKREKAQAEATEKRVSAQVSLYAAGVLFLVFVGLILLIVLLKIERNLRNGGLTTAAPTA